VGKQRWLDATAALGERAPEGVEVAWCSGGDGIQDAVLVGLLLEFRCVVSLFSGRARGDGGRGASWGDGGEWRVQGRDRRWDSVGEAVARSWFPADCVL